MRPCFIAAESFEDDSLGFYTSSGSGYDGCPRLCLERGHDPYGVAHPTQRTRAPSKTRQTSLLMLHRSSLRGLVPAIASAHRFSFELEGNSIHEANAEFSLFSRSGLLSWCSSLRGGAPIKNPAPPKISPTRESVASKILMTKELL